MHLCLFDLLFMRLFMVYFKMVITRSGGGGVPARGGLIGMQVALPAQVVPPQASLNLYSLNARGLR